MFNMRCRLKGWHRPLCLLQNLSSPPLVHSRASVSHLTVMTHARNKPPQVGDVKPSSLSHTVSPTPIVRFLSRSAALRSRIGKRDTSVSPLFLSMEKHLGRLAVADRLGQFTYDDLLHRSTLLSQDLVALTGADSSTSNLDLARVGFLCENDASFVVSQLAVWMAKGVCVPLCKTHPVSELEYFVRDSDCSVLVASQSFADKLQPLADKLSLPLRVIEDCELLSPYEVNAWFISEKASSTKRSGKAFKKRPQRWYDLHFFNNGFKNDPALIVYTSGTTGRPKGVVLTHGNVGAMVTNMVTAWGWTAQDAILHVLPLHHVHGLVNALFTPLHTGATCLMLPKFDPQQVWNCLVNPAIQMHGVRVNMFMAVPTMYAHLIQHYNQHAVPSQMARNYVKSVCSTRIRLMVSGSAALPQPVMERWEEITGHRLLERYGMTEIGMALTNSLSGTRVPGAVGKPFPSVEVCIARPNVYKSNGYDPLAYGNARRTRIVNGEEGEMGELLVKGPSVFHKYWNRPEATAETFTPDGWFKTGDTAAVSEDGVYRIVGRTSVDVIKSGGYKISALDVERHLLSHPDIVDVAVVGLPDITWGQRVAAVVVLTKGSEINLPDLKAWAREVMPPYQVPSVLQCLPAVPRNAMGKVNKKELVADVFPEYLRTH